MLTTIRVLKCDQPRCSSAVHVKDKTSQLLQIAAKNDGWNFSQSSSGLHYCPKHNTAEKRRRK